LDEKSRIILDIRNQTEPNQRQKNITI